MRDIDTGKMQALYLAGWTDFMIATEMGISEEEVKEVFAEIAEEQRKFDALVVEQERLTRERLDL
jgi:hypothetical protein